MTERDLREDTVVLPHGVEVTVRRFLKWTPMFAREMGMSVEEALAWFEYAPYRVSGVVDGRRIRRFGVPFNKTREMLRRMRQRGLFDEMLGHLTTIATDPDVRLGEEP